MESLIDGTQYLSQKMSDLVAFNVKCKNINLPGSQWWSRPLHCPTGNDYVNGVFDTIREELGPKPH